MAKPQLSFRLPPDLVKRLDAYADRLNRENPGLGVTRVDAVRALLTQALDAIEAPARKRSR